MSMGLHHISQQQQQPLHHTLQQPQQHDMSQQHQQPHLHALHKPERQQSVRSHLSKTDELLFQHVQGVKLAAQQRPQPRVTGNPFADPEDMSEHDDDDDSHHPAVSAAQPDPGENQLDSQLPASAPLHSHDAPGQQQPVIYTDFVGKSAWDAISVPAPPAAMSNEGSEVGRYSSKLFTLHHCPVP